MVPAKWREHFETLLNGVKVSASANKLGILDDGQDTESSTLDELDKAVTELKSSKATKKDQLPTELFELVC